jgi:pilus assembly protein CpaC
MLQVGAPQQVMLEVKMAEISKNLLDQLGVAFNFSRANGNVAYSLLKGFGVADLGGKLTFTNGQTSVTIDAEKKDTLIKVLAEPNIIAISGQEGSFLAGGQFFIPVPQAGAIGGVGAITLEERNFGVGLRFTPTVLDDGMINLRVAPEVTELLSTTIPIGVGTSPTLSTRRVATTVQLRDGQSFAIAGLIRSNITEDIKRFPILGELPIIGALFRSSAFKDEKTELLFVVTPRLVKPLPPDYALPTDSFNQPSRTEFFIEGKLEGKPDVTVSVPQAAPAAAPAAQGANDGFEMK